MKKVLVGGCFDIFHYGHLVFLTKAKMCGDYLVVALEPDETVRRLKGKNRPVHTQKQRAELLQSLRTVDEVVCLTPLSTYEDYFTLVQKIRPEVIAVTQGDPQEKNKRKMAQAVHAEVVAVTPPIPHASTSRLIHILANEG